MKTKKMLSKVFKFEMLVWFAWIHLTGSITDLIIDKYPIIWARSSWIDFRDLCNSVNSKDFRKKLEKAQEVYEIREKEVAEMEHQRDKYSDDEIDQARKNLREDKANLKTQEDIIDNGKDLAEMCENKEKQFEEYFGLKCDDLDMRNNWLVAGSILGSFFCLTLLHSNAKPNFETLNGAKFVGAMLLAMIFTTANAVQCIHVIFYWFEARKELQSGDIHQKNLYKNLNYGEQPDKDEIKLICKYDFLRYNLIVHGCIFVSSFLMCVVLVCLNFKKAKHYRKSMDLDNAPDQERAEEIKEKKHKEELKMLNIPKAGENPKEQKKGGWNSDSKETGLAKNCDW
ncbi:unnamed protein product [Oikopleura dioica]|uniref:Uncharacterized protein n=1 Tax=Oikopleura dioica TaxID=34765 RepID=E4WWY5_OIKDI|nr:unnamed protein product [Oikopleura dioica]